MEVTIPFDGFYYSIHDENFNSALDMMFSDDRGNVFPSLRDSASDLINWQACHLVYAQKYTEVFSDEFEIALKFKLMCSPKYYNFETDRIVAHIDHDEVLRLLQLVDNDIFMRTIRDRFTSRDGFISHYPNDFDCWPDDIENWDHNHVGTLLIAYIETHHKDDYESFRVYTFDRGMGSSYELCDSIMWNNCDHVKMNRLLKIREYLTIREGRK